MSAVRPRGLPAVPWQRLAEKSVDQNLGAQGV